MLILGSSESSNAATPQPLVNDGSGVSAFEKSVFLDGEGGGERLLVLILSRLGLANRLRSLADWHQVAIQSNRTLLVSWQATSDCNTHFFDLFQGGPKRLKFLPFALPAEDAGVRSVIESTKRMGLSYRAYYETAAGGGQDIGADVSGEYDFEAMFTGEYKSFVLRRDAVFNEASVVVTHYDGIVALEGQPCQQYLVMHSAFLSQLQPIAEVRRLVRDFIDDYFSSNVMIGVHVRVHDPAQDWAVVPPLMGNPEAKQFGDGATLQHFADAMQKIQAKFSPLSNPLSSAIESVSGATESAPEPRVYDREELRSTSSVRFFVASNSEDVKRQLINAFPGSLSISGAYDRNSTAGIKFALVEWLILAESALLLNTYGSSFAAEAALLHQRPLVGVWDGRLIHHCSVLLPHCGHMQFAKAYSRQGVPTNYREGTVDRREVSQHLPIRPLLLSLLWGIIERY